MTISNQQLDNTCKPVWDAAVTETPDILEEFTYEEFKIEVKVELALQNLVAIGAVEQVN